MGDIEEPIAFREEFIQQIFTGIYYMPGIVLRASIQQWKEQKKERKRYKKREEGYTREERGRAGGEEGGRGGGGKENVQYFCKQLIVPILDG